MNFVLSNVDKEFSQLLAQYKLRNQVIESRFSWEDRPESFAFEVFKGIVEDYQLKGPEFHVTMKDVTVRYFDQNVPKFRITAAEYPNANTNFFGNMIPEALGLLSHTAGVSPGEMEAICINTVTFKYLLSRGSLKAVDQIYSEGKLVSPSLYTISYEDGGRTYVTFLRNQKDRKITWNGKGYMYSEWNSVNGYVQDPVYVLAFFLAFIMEVPESLLDLNSFEVVRAILNNISSEVPLSGKMPLQGEKKPEDVIMKLLAPMGAVLYQDRSGRMALGLKDITNIQNNNFVFTQTDCFDSPDRKDNFNLAVNRARAVFDFAPAASIFKSEAEDENETSIKDLDGVIEQSEPFKYENTTSRDLVEKRLADELIKRGFGFKKISFPVHIRKIEDLDIFSNFRLQDPFGIDISGNGEFGRYCYVSRVDINFSASRLEIESIDLSYVLRTYFVVGSEDDLAPAWETAPDDDRAFAYVADETTGKFSTGEDAKILIDENLLYS
jgi:hypothetical protein